LDSDDDDEDDEADDFFPLLHWSSIGEGELDLELALSKDDVGDEDVPPVQLSFPDCGEFGVEALSRSADSTDR
jgi:hypothetical protein